MLKKKIGVKRSESEAIIWSFLDANVLFFGCPERPRSELPQHNPCVTDSVCSGRALVFPRYGCLVTTELCLHKRDCSASHSLAHCIDSILHGSRVPSAYPPKMTCQSSPGRRIKLTRFRIIIPRESQYAKQADAMGYCRVYVGTARYVTHSTQLPFISASPTRCVEVSRRESLPLASWSHSFYTHASAHQWSHTFHAFSCSWCVCSNGAYR